MRRSSSVSTACAALMCVTALVACCLTFDMSGDRKPAQPAGGRPLDGGVRFHRRAKQARTVATMRMVTDAASRTRPRPSGLFRALRKSWRTSIPRTASRNTPRTRNAAAPKKPTSEVCIDALAPSFHDRATSMSPKTRPIAAKMMHRANTLDYGRKSVLGRADDGLAKMNLPLA